MWDLVLQERPPLETQNKVQSQALQSAFLSGNSPFRYLLPTLKKIKCHFCNFISLAWLIKVSINPPKVNFHLLSFQWSLSFFLLFPSSVNSGTLDLFLVK